MMFCFNYFFIYHLLFFLFSFPFCLIYSPFFLSKFFFLPIFFHIFCPLFFGARHSANTFSQSPPPRKLIPFPNFSNSPNLPNFQSFFTPNFPDTSPQINYCNSESQCCCPQPWDHSTNPHKKGPHRPHCPKRHHAAPLFLLMNSLKNKHNHFHILLFEHLL